jgi:hypothetical protein
VNKDKRGKPYSYPDALILAVREWPAGRRRDLLRFSGSKDTVICRKQKEPKYFLMRNKLVDIAIDSTGIKAFNRGIRQKRDRRGG